MLFVSRGYLEQATELFNRAMSQDELSDNLKLYLSFWIRDLGYRLHKQPDARAMEFITRASPRRGGPTTSPGTLAVRSTLTQLLAAAVRRSGEKAEAYFYEGMRRAIKDGDEAGLALMKRGREDGE